MASIIETLKRWLKGIKGGKTASTVATPPQQVRPQTVPVRRSSATGNRHQPRPAAKTGASGDRPQRSDQQRRGTRSQQPRERQKPPVRPREERVQEVPVSSTPAWDPASYKVEKAEGQTRFTDLNIPIEILHAVADLNFQYCTPVQAEILPKTLQGLDATGRAQTGTGKTGAFLITVLTFLLRNRLEEKLKPGTPRALVLAPTRELAIQIEKDAQSLGKYCPSIRTIAVYGGMDYTKQQKMLARGPVDIIVATPGRLLDFKAKGGLSLSKVEIMVIDEADRMLDMGFIPDVRRIIESTPPKTRRQTMLFSATLTPEVVRLASRWTKDAVTVEITPEQVTTDSIDQKVYIVTAEAKFRVLYNMIAQQGFDRVIVFCNRRDESLRTAEKFAKLGVSTGLLSGDVSQERRIKTLEAFRSGDLRVLVATDVAARGLHIDDVSHVVNYSLPLNAEDYVHRIGRTGRAGATGVSVSFADEMDAQQLPAIEQYIGKSLTCLHPDEAWLREPAPVKETPAPLLIERAPRHEDRRGKGHTHGRPHRGHNPGNRRQNPGGGGGEGKS